MNLIKFFWFLGADISNVVNEAAIRAATTSKKIVTVEELDYALQRILGGMLFVSFFMKFVFVICTM